MEQQQQLPFGSFMPATTRSLFAFLLGLGGCSASTLIVCVQEAQNLADLDAGEKPGTEVRAWPERAPPTQLMSGGLDHMLRAGLGRVCRSLRQRRHSG
jgi:hypothetical protein